MILGIVIWGLAAAAGAVGWMWSRKRARTEPPGRTPQQVWDETDPQYRRRLSGPPSDGGWGSPL